MTTASIEYISCDGGKGCPIKYPANIDMFYATHNWPILAQQRIFKTKGWLLCHHGKDYCPDCRHQLIAEGKL